MTKKNILKVATQQFAKLGYDGLSMNKLASKLDVNKATIYYHFKDKQSLYLEVVTNLITIKRKETENIINSDTNPKTKFRQYINLYVEAIVENPEIVPLSLREMANFGNNVKSGIEKDFEDELKYIRALVDELDLKEKYKQMDLYELKSLIMGTINSYYVMQNSQLNIEGLKDLDNDDEKILAYISDFISNILLDALCKEQPNN
ncbi:MAG: TetR/AcrR family transcriptional regulator [Campylobacterota bacterium]|nr:TetR/AcrR family transcriptional regulator [Campylobacterota bacterium]